MTSPDSPVSPWQLTSDFVNGLTAVNSRRQSHQWRLSELLTILPGCRLLTVTPVDEPGGGGGGGLGSGKHSEINQSNGLAARYSLQAQAVKLASDGQCTNKVTGLKLMIHFNVWIDARHTVRKNETDSLGPAINH